MSAHDGLPLRAVEVRQGVGPLAAYRGIVSLR